MAEVDTSSYPKPVAQPGLLDTVGKFQDLAGKVQEYKYRQEAIPQALEQQKIGIDQTKLNLMNDHFKIANQELATIADDATITPEKLKIKLDNFAKTVSMPPQVYQHMLSEFAGLKTPDEIRNQAKLALTRGMSTQERINKVYGASGGYSTGAQYQPTLQRTGEGPTPSAPPIQLQPPPITPTIGPDDKPTLLGAQEAQLPPGAVPAPGGGVGQFIPVNRLPVAPPPMAPPDASTAPPPVLNKPQDQVPQGVPSAPPGQIVPRGPVTGFSPMFEEGKKALAQDQDLAARKAIAIKPALQALPLMKDIMSGPGTGKFTQAVAALKGFGIIPTATKNDPTAVQQEVIKKMYQYVSQNPVGQRSDAAQTLAEAGSPNPNVQILPALKKLTQDAVAIDRLQIAMPGAFEGGNLEKYGNHRATFPSSMDEKAFTIDLMEPEERKSLIAEMKKNKDTFKGKKFWKSLAIVDKQGLIDTSE